MLLLGCSGKGSPPASAGKKGEGGVPVSVAKVIRRSVPVEIQAVGNAEAFSTITVKAQVGGELTQVSFREGDYVKKDDPLFVIDPRPLRATLDQALANVERDQAMLGQAQANLERDKAQADYARSQAERYARLAQEGIISKEQAEQVRTAADVARQAINADEAAIRSARASVVAGQAAADNARLQMGYTAIRSPIDGRTGNINIKQGNIVSANSTDLTTINQVQPIYVTFSIPEVHIGEIKRYLAAGKIPVMASPQDDPTQVDTGTLAFIDNAVDASTGTIKMKGTFANAERRLWPGEFLRVTLRLTVKPDALVVPNQAVQAGQEGEFVYVVKADRSVEARKVTTAGRVENAMVIDEGLEEGETVVTEGQFRLAPGSRVQVRQPGGAGGRERPKS